MGLLNLNKKTGDKFTAAEVNQMGAAIDQNTKDIAELRSSMMYWFVDYDEGNNTALTVGGNMDIRQNYFDMCGRIIVNRNGDAARLNATNSNLFEDGTEAKHDGSYGQTMAFRPPLYGKVVRLSPSVTRIYKSPTPMQGFTLLYDTIVEGAFLGSVKTIDGKICLMSIADTLPKDSINMTTAWGYAQNYGKDWGLMNWTAWNADNLLAHDFCKNRNVRPTLGSGIIGGSNSGAASGNAYKILSGCTLSLGNTSGKISVTAPDTSEQFSEVSLFGKESAWGKKWQFIAGNIHHGNTIYIWDDNKVVNGTPPSEVNYRTAYFANEAANNWKGVLKMAFNEQADMLPTAYQDSRNETLNYAASWYLNGAGEILRGGGRAAYGAACCPGYVVASYSFGSAAWSIVPRLSYYGKLKFVNGKELVASAG